MSISYQSDDTLYTRHLHILDHIINSLKIFLLQRVSLVMRNFFPILLKFKEKLRVLLKKNISYGKEMSKDTNGTRSEIEFTLVEDPINMHRTALNETSLVSEIPNTIDKENVIIVPGQGKTPVSILSDEFCEKQAFTHLFPKDKYDFIIP